MNTMYTIIKSNTTIITPEYLIIFDTNINKLEIKQLDKIMSNVFLSTTQVDIIIDIFCKIKRVLNGFSRFKQRWLFNRAKIYNSDDLYMNPIDPAGKNVVTLLQNKTKYVFQLRELITSINNSLAHTVHFFAEPIICKNAYTNIPFTKSALYTIYFHIKTSTYIMPTLFHKYFLCDFNMTIFTINNDYLVNDEFLETFVKNNCKENVISIVKDMFGSNGFDGIRIHKEFPKDKMYAIMKPYLDLYYISHYSSNYSKKDIAKRLLYNKLYEFCKYNPHFGRKKIKITHNKIFSTDNQKYIVFNDRHIPFYDTVVMANDFMKSHLIKWTPDMIPTPQQETLDTIAMEIESDSDSDSESTIETSDIDTLIIDTEDDDDDDDDDEEENN